MRWLLPAAVMMMAMAPAHAALPADGAFDDTAHPAPPDYAHRADWAIWRGGKASSPIDLFFIPPTTFVSRRWNQDLADGATDRWTRISVANRQINAFAACCRLYSPRYRQASSRAFTDMTGDGAKAYALAYQDVRAAFRWYLAHANHGRPFVIAAHSQGSLHALRLLEQEIDGTPLARQLVAVYAPGIGIPRSLFGHTLTTVGPCDHPDSTHCIASWNSYTPEADVGAFRQRSLGRSGGGNEGLLCIDPLTFDAGRPAAGPDANLGAMLAPPDDNAQAPLVAQAAGAACRDGVLRIDARVPLTALPGGVLHFYDIPLFWANIRANVAIRIRAYHKEHAR
jgi:hypothetical protein